jgi:hypothetical protein
MESIGEEELCRCELCDAGLVLLQLVFVPAELLRADGVLLLSPDHLVLCLRAFARMNSSSAEDFASCLLSAVSKMVAAMRGADNPFENLLLTIEWTVTPQ